MDSRQFAHNRGTLGWLLTTAAPRHHPHRPAAGQLLAPLPQPCIPPPPPDLDCGDIPYKNLTVAGCDPHRFDGDHDGIGCER